MKDTPQWSRGAVKPLRLLPVLIVALAIWFSPAPAGVDPRAWRLLAIFVGTIVGLIARPLPMGGVAILAIAATSLTGALTTEESFSGFGNRVIWLVVVAFFISRGFIKTGLLNLAKFGYKILLRRPRGAGTRACRVSCACTRTPADSCGTALTQDKSRHECRGAKHGNSAG